MGSKAEVPVERDAEVLGVVVEGNTLTVERQLESLILDEVWKLSQVNRVGAFVGSDGESP